jgi:hypothetical protein
MLKLAAYFLIFLIAVTTVFVAGARTFSPIFQSCIQQDKNASTQNSAEKQPSSLKIAVDAYVRCTGSFAESHHGVITGLATLIIASFTGTLWWATWSLLIHGREVERAYVSGGGPHDPEKGIFQLQINNYGKTPAILTAVSIEFCELNNIPPTPTYRWMATQGTYKPGDHGRAIMNLAIPSLQKPVVYGRFRYIDIWRKSHVSSFILAIHKDGILPTSISPDCTFWD